MNNAFFEHFLKNFFKEQLHVFNSLNINKYLMNFQKRKRKN